MIMGIGIHVVDTAHYMLGLKNPRGVSAGGGVYFYKDGRDTPDTVALIMDYPEGVTLTFAAEALSAPGVKTSAGVELRGTGGKLWVERYSAKDCLVYTPNEKVSRTPAAKSDGMEASAEPMLRNWLDCIQSRQKAIANEVVAYYSTVACYMGLEAFRTQSRVAWKREWDLPA
jgi:predicted dehydrogenase